MKGSKIKWMYLLSFVFSLHVAVSAYINSTFLTGIMSEKYVGLLFAISSILTLVFMSQGSEVLKKLGNRRLTLSLLVINLFGLTGLITSGNPYIIGTSFVLFITTNIIFFFCIDIFIEHFGNPKYVGKTRGIYLTIINFAWVISPLITMTLLSRNNNYTAVYLVAFVAVIITIFGLLFSIPHFIDRSYIKAPFIKTYKFLKTNHHIVAVTIINFILQFFYALMIVYTPIYLNKHLGLPWDKIGIIFIVMLTPFVIFSSFVGFLIDKYKIHKRILITIGLLIMSISTISISIITTKSILILTIILFLTRVGASVAEATADIYFFTHTKEEEAHLLGFFRDMYPVAYIVGPIFGTVFLSLFPFKYIFLALGIITLLGLFYIPKLKHTRDEPQLSNTN